MILLIKHSSAPTNFVLNLEKALKSAFEECGHQLTTLVESALPDAVNVFKSFANEKAEVLIVATEADTETGWFRDHVGVGRRKKGTVVTFFGEVDPGILNAFGGINFAPRREDSRHAFVSLCAHFGVEVPNERGTDKLEADFYNREILPPIGIRSSTFHEDLFRQLQTTATVILLAQAGRGEKPFVQQIMNRATVHYGESCVLHVTPPSSLDVTSGELFKDLGEKCGFKGVERQYDWERALKSKVAEKGPLFLLLSRFEHASSESQASIAKVLRGVSDELDWAGLHIVVCGSKRLVEQKFVVGAHSFLNHAYPMLYPDLEVDDLVEWVEREVPESILPYEDAAYLLERYGGHPGLLKYALGILRQVRPGDDDNPMEAVRIQESLDWFVQYFLPYARDEQDRKSVCGYLKDPEALGRFGFWHQDEIVRRLFWDNLLTKDEEDKLRWRSEAIIDAGLEILNCDAQVS